MGPLQRQVFVSLRLCVLSPAGETRGRVFHWGEADANR